MTTTPAAAALEINRVIKADEGGYVLSHDPDGGDGGWTFAGLIASNAAVWGVTAAQLQASPDLVVSLYYQHFWVPARVDQVSAEVRGAYYSAAVNHGPGTATMILQAACGLAADGQFGPITAAAAARSRIDPFCRAWIRRYAQIIHDNPSAKGRYDPGWTERVLRYWPASGAAAA